MSSRAAMPDQAISAIDAILAAHGMEPLSGAARRRMLVFLEDGYLNAGREDRLDEYNDAVLLLAERVVDKLRQLPDQGAGQEMADRAQLLSRKPRTETTSIAILGALRAVCPCWPFC